MSNLSETMKKQVEILHKKGNFNEKPKEEEEDDEKQPWAKIKAALGIGK